MIGVLIFTRDDIAGDELHSMFDEVNDAPSGA